MATTRSLSLHNTFLLFAGSFALLAVLASFALAVLTTYLHRTAIGIESALESIHLAEQMEVLLLSHNRANDSFVRRSLETDLRQAAGEANAYVGSDTEQQLLATAADQLEQYFAAARKDEVGSEFDDAVGTVRRLIQVNLEQGRSLKRQAAHWDQRANAGSAALGVLLVAGLGGLMLWVRASVFRPAVALAGAIERYSAGDRAARASEAGPREFQSIAHRFNEMAASLDTQRDSQLAFLAGVAHDLRNPLSALKVASSLISPDRALPPEDRVRQTFARVQRQISKLDQMVNDFLDAQQIQAGTLKLKREECDPLELVRATVELFEPTAPNHQLIVKAEGAPPRLSCDPARIEQVLNNLVSNAIKYSPKGGSITLTVGRDDAEALLSVTDEGLGIANVDTSLVFEPFRRAATSSLESIPGIGLGLFVSRRIVEAHDGWITVQTAPGKGSTFTLHLPRSCRDS